MHRLLMLFCFFAVFSVVTATANAQNTVTPSDPDRPDVSGWTRVSESNISVNVSDSVMYYLGFDLKFQNPEKPTEFVRQIRIVTPFVVVKSKDILDKNYSDAAVAYATDGTEKALLKDYLTKSDVILHVRWNVEPDLKRKTEKLVGENEVWFWDVTGAWTYGRDLKIGQLMPSENFSGFSKYPIIVGVKYFLNRSIYNSTEVPSTFILIALKAAKGGK